MKKLVAFSYGAFPQGGASAVRLCSIAKLFMEFGYEVYVVAMGNSEQYKWGIYEGIHYVSLRSASRNLVSRIQNVLKYKERAKKKIAKIGQIDTFLLMGVSVDMYKFCEEFSRINGTRLIADCTEWYSKSEFKLGVFSPEYRRNIKINERVLDTQWKTISITTYFEKYFLQKGITTVRIPAIMDISEFPPHSTVVNKERVVVYAGSPAQKDSLDVIISGFKLAEKKINGRIKLRVIGMTRKQFIDTYNYSDLPNCVEFLGRIPRSEVLKHLSSCEFTTLIRDDKERYAKAGFPSKVAESLSAGVPVIANLSSDLGLVLRHRKNAVIVEQPNAEAYKNALIEVLKLSDVDINQMIAGAYSTAKETIDYRNYRASIDELLKSYGSR